MLLYKIIFYCSMAIWLLPPFKQRGTRYFYFFLIMAITDPINRILYNIFTFYSLQTYLIADYLAFLLLYDKEIIKKYWVLNMAGIISTVFIACFIRIDLIRYILSVIDFAILLVFLKNFIVHSYRKKQITLFYLILIMYGISAIVKFVLVIIEVQTGLMYFLFTNVMQIMIALYFAFFNEDKPGWALSLTENGDAVE